MSEKTEGGAPGVGTGGEGAPTEDLHLWKLPRGRHGLPRELVAQSQRERLLAAVIRVTASQGYQAASVGDVLSEAGVGRESFYQHFKDKRDCFLAANDALVDSLESRVTEAYAQGAEWPERVRRGLRAALEWFAASPAVAWVMLVEMGRIGPAATSRFREAFHRFAALLDEGADYVRSDADIPGLASIAGGAVFAAVYDQVTLGNSVILPELAPQLTFELLLPYLGEEAAARERELAAGEAPEREERGN